MKRLIDGVSYNTDTATLLARSDYEGDWNNNTCPVEGELFQTRGGAFFIVEKIAIGETDPGHSGSETITKTRFSKCSEEAARHWITTGEVEVFLNPFEDKMTEDETEGTVYVRMPANLKRRIEVLAESAGLSANAWAIRCFEQCANVTQRLARSE
jgi:predicted HicB family RNase H-like nuclease